MNETKKDNRGVKAGTKRGKYTITNKRKKTKTKFLFGYKYNQDEYDEMKATFEAYKKRNNLTSTEALKKIILEKK